MSQTNGTKLAAVRRLMEEEGITRTEACRELGFSESSVRRWEQESPLPDEPSEIPTFYRDFSDQSAHYVYPLGDVHKGSPAHNQDKWQEWLSFLKTRGRIASMIGTGDFLNSALKTSVSETYDEVLTVGQAKREIRSDLNPIRDQIDLLVPGNHEARIYRAIGDCPVEDLADSLGVGYSRTVALLHYKVGEIDYTFFVKHGTGAGQIGARANRLRRTAETIHADVYISGHTHNELVFPEEVFVYNPDNRRVERRRRYFVSSGSFVRYEDYGAVAGFQPVKMGAPRIRLNGERWDVHVSI